MTDGKHDVLTQRFGKLLTYRAHTVISNQGKIQQWDCMYSVEIAEK